jgi:hypothetical protein
MIGEPRDVYYAVSRAGWDETRMVSAVSGFKAAISFLAGGEYRYSPVSGLYAFGRRQGVVLPKIRSRIHNAQSLSAVADTDDPGGNARLDRADQPGH